jgi:hypothetical protein
MANLQGIRVSIYLKQGSGDDTEWKYVTSTLTDANGDYSLGGLGAGDYRLKFNDPNDAYLTEYYNGKSTLDTADTINVTAATTVSGKNAVLGAASFVEGTITDS